MTGLAGMTPRLALLGPYEICFGTREVAHRDQLR